MAPRPPIRPSKIEPTIEPRSLTMDDKTLTELRDFYDNTDLSESIEQSELVDDATHITMLETKWKKVEAENTRLRAQVASIGKAAHPGTYAPPGSAPDDTEINQDIDDAETFGEAIWEIGDKYEIPLTNNMERWSEGRYIRHAGSFYQDIRDAADKHLVAPVAAELTVANGALERLRTYARKCAAAGDTATANRILSLIYATPEPEK